MSSSKPPGPDTAIRNYPKLLTRYERLLELTSDLAATFDLDTLLQRIVEAARELTDSEASSLLLYEKQTHSLYFEAATGALVSVVSSPSEAEPRKKAATITKTTTIAITRPRSRVAVELVGSF